MKDREERDGQDREEMERRDIEERERRDREEKERRFREERDRSEREREEQERRDREERKERERREIEDRERREREETERRAQEEADRFANSKAEQERLRQKELLLAKMKEIDNTAQDNATMSPSRRRNYTFTKPIENLHSGKRSHEENPVPVLERHRRRSLLDEESDSDGGYKPSFVPRTGSQSKPKNNFLFDEEPKPKPPANPKKANLMADLFGDSTKTGAKKNSDDDIFQLSPTTKRKADASRRQNNGIVFGSDSEDKPSSGSLLPRRSRQHTSTLHTRPTVNAVDDIEDDIEELTL